MNLYSLLNIEHHTNLNVPNAERIETILNEEITSKLKPFGLDNKSKKYIWQSNYNESGIRSIIQFTRRGVTGNFWIGKNFKSIPFLMQNKKTRNYSFKPHLFESITYFDSEKNISLWNESFFRKSLKKVMDKNLNNIMDFLNNLNVIESNINWGQSQINSGNFEYKLRDPDIHYVLAYLYDKQQNYNEAHKAKSIFLDANDNYDDSIFRSLD